MSYQSMEGIHSIKSRMAKYLPTTFYIDIKSSKLQWLQ